jgi:hypothetical protein
VNAFSRRDAMNRQNPSRARGTPFGIGSPPFLGILLLTAFALGASGCGLLRGEREPAWGIGGERSDRFTIEVENQNFNQARIYARWNGDRRRIGSVGGNQTETFTLRWSSRQLRLEVDFVAGGGFVSDPITVNQGDNLIFRIPARAR